MTGQGISQAEYQAMRARLMTEAELQAAVIGLAGRQGWMVYHTHDSRRSQAGYPDLHLIHPDTGRSMFRELKTQRGRIRPAQAEWLDGLARCGVDAAVWRPADWFDDTIDRQLHHDPVAGRILQLAAEMGVDLYPWQVETVAKAVAHPGAPIHVARKDGTDSIRAVAAEYARRRQEARR